MTIRLTFLLLVLGLASPLASAQLIGLYEFNGTFANSLSGGGALDSLETVNASGGVTTGFSSGAWSWSNAVAPGTGLKLSLGEPLSAYSIGIVFQLSEVNSWRRLLKFSDTPVDQGIYIEDGRFMPYFASDEGGGGGSVIADSLVTMVLTRDGAGNVEIYADGSHSGAWARDLDDEMVNDSWRFFVDDGGDFSAGGSVHEIRIWDYALSSGEIATAFDAVAVPEPSTCALLAGLGAVGLAAWRRRATAKTQTAA